MRDADNVRLDQECVAVDLGVGLVVGLVVDLWWDLDTDDRTGTTRRTRGRM